MEERCDEYELAGRHRQRVPDNEQCDPQQVHVLVRSLAWYSIRGCSLPSMYVTVYRCSLLLKLDLLGLAFPLLLSGLHPSTSTMTTTRSTIWSRHFLGPTTGSYTPTVPPHQVYVLFLPTYASLWAMPLARHRGILRTNTMRSNGRTALGTAKTQTRATMVTGPTSRVRVWKTLVG